MEIELGAMAPKLKDQPRLAGCFADDRLALWQKRVDAVTILHVCGFANDSETNRIERRIVKAMCREASGSVTTSGASTAPETP